MKEECREPDVFEPDEMQLQNVNLQWSAEDLLEQRAIFFLKDILTTLDLDTYKVKKHIERWRRKGQDPYQVMGVRKIWIHWLVRMKTFAPYYRNHFISEVRKVEKGWDANILIRQKGWFYLTEVCKLLPFSTHQIRYQAKKAPNSREALGIWRHTELNCFLVDMERFGPWVKGIWQELHAVPSASKKSKPIGKKGTAK